MKYKHEKEIRNIAMLALLIVLILGKLGKVKIQIIIAYICCLGCIFLGIYFIYKGLKLVGTVMFLLVLIGTLVILSYYNNSYILAVPIPGVFVIILMIAYKAIEILDDKNQIRDVKKNALVGIILFSIAQIVMIALLFIKH